MASEEFELKPVNDDPSDNAKLLGHDVIVQTLKAFIESNEMISSSSIAIHGDWGTGKTSIMTTLASKLDQDKIEVLFFEAWKYEYSNPSLALIAEISNKYHGKDGELAKRIVEAAVYILTDKFLGVDVRTATQILRGNAERISSIVGDLETIVFQINKKLVIIIDDLDRCDVENSLQILAMMKLFLSIHNCIVIAAVDFNRLQQAWKMKYNVKDNDNDDGHDSRDYLDKIFQIRIGIPVPSQDRIKEYLLSLTNNMSDDLKEIFATFTPKNPRAIKRMLNLISYRSYLLNSPHSIYSACLWTLLEQDFGNHNFVWFYERISTEKSLANLIFDSNWETTRNTVNRTCPRPLLDKIDQEKLKKFVEHSHKLVQQIGIIRNDLEQDFSTLYIATNESR